MTTKVRTWNRVVRRWQRNNGLPNSRESVQAWIKLYGTQYSIIMKFRRLSVAQIEDLLY